MGKCRRATVILQKRGIQLFMEAGMVRVTTDTATICLFDPSCLRHRLDDLGDWWSIPENELAEVNAGNALILNVGSDGSYDVSFEEAPINGMSQFALRIPTGRLFVGQGEQLTGGGLEPDVAWGGEIREFKPGLYLCSLLKKCQIIHVFMQSGGSGVNKLDNLINL